MNHPATYTQEHLEIAAAITIVVLAAVAVVHLMRSALVVHVIIVVL